MGAIKMRKCSLFLVLILMCLFSVLLMSCSPSMLKGAGRKANQVDVLNSPYVILVSLDGLYERLAWRILGSYIGYNINISNIVFRV